MDNDEEIRKEAARIYARLATWQRDVFAEAIQSLWKAENNFTGYSEDFERFWEAFPAHKRTEKEKAYREWERAISNWKKSRQKSDQAFDFKEFLLARVITYGQTNLGRSVYARSVARWLYHKVFDEDESLWDGKYRGRGSKDHGSDHDARNSYKRGSI